MTLFFAFFWKFFQYIFSFLTVMNVHVNKHSISCTRLLIIESSDWSVKITLKETKGKLEDARQRDSESADGGGDGHTWHNLHIKLR